MVAVLLILDGASEARDAPVQSLELAATPALDRLAAEGSREWLPVLPDGVPVGSETAIAALLGWVPDGPVDRAAVEAAARGMVLDPGQRPWRIDLGTRPHRHKLILAGGETPPALVTDVPVKVWPAGAIPPRILDRSTVVIGAAGAATGLARLMGARVVIPAGATGHPGSDLTAKRDAALDAIGGDANRVVVHVGGADEASHDRDRAAKLAVLEEADRALIGPLYAAVAAQGGSITVCPDHGCDPESGEHVPGPVPVVSWSQASAATPAGEVA